MNAWTNGPFGHFRAHKYRLNWTGWVSRGWCDESNDSAPCRHKTRFPRVPAVSGPARYLSGAYEVSRETPHNIECLRASDGVRAVLILIFPWHFSQFVGWELNVVRPKIPVIQIKCHLVASQCRKGINQQKKRAAWKYNALLNMGPDLTSRQRRARRWRDVKSGPWTITGNLDRTFASAASKADI